jgi:ubiquinone/menaquinone biosynthesis C-methylase UbiE
MKKNQPQWSGEMYDKSFFGHHCELVAKDLIQISKLQENFHILDAGCGTGAITSELVKKKEKLNITAVDNNLEMLKCVQKVQILF